MRETMIAVAAFALAAGSAKAAIGDTEVISDARYTRTSQIPAQHQVSYVDGARHIREIREVFSDEGLCERILYLPKSDQLSLSEIESFLAENRLPSLESNFWEPQVRRFGTSVQWFSRNGKFSATIGYVWGRPYSLQVDADRITNEVDRASR